MQTYEILVKERAIVPNSKDMSLVRTSIGIDQVHILFDNAEWLGFPLKITFSQGEDIVTQSLVVSEVTGSNWVAEATVTVPHEVIDMVGKIKVTIQGTDNEGRHIITAKGFPLKVEEAGDVIDGSMPEDAPTLDEWYQAYAKAVKAANDAQSLVENLEARLGSMVSEAETALDERMSNAAKPATTRSLGVVQVGDGLSVTEEGVLSAESNAGMTEEQADVLDKLSQLAQTSLGVDVAEDIPEDVSVKTEVLPIATLDNLGVIYPDGTSVTVDDDGMLHASAVTDLVIATADSAGIVKPDGTTITVDPDGTIHGAEGTRIATTSTVGMVKPDGTTMGIDESGTIYLDAKVNVDVIRETTVTVGQSMTDAYYVTLNRPIVPSETYEVTVNGTSYSVVPVSNQGTITFKAGPMSFMTYDGIAGRARVSADAGDYVVRMTEIVKMQDAVSDTVALLPTFLTEIPKATASTLGGIKIGSSLYISNDGVLSQGAGAVASGYYAHAEGSGTTASSPHSHAEGSGSRASGTSSHAEGGATSASGNYAHSEGSGTNAIGSASHAEGQSSKASGDWSHSEGSTEASGAYAHSEGSGSKAIGGSSHAEGSNTSANSYGAHSEGMATKAAGNYSHAEGIATEAGSEASHAEGNSTRALGSYSHAGGVVSKAYGVSSFAHGMGAEAFSTNSHPQVVFGAYNERDATDNDGTLEADETYALIIGNGTSDSNRSNLFAVRWDGGIEVNGEEFGVSSDTPSESPTENVNASTTVSEEGSIVRVDDRLIRLCLKSSSEDSVISPTYTNLWNGQAVYDAVYAAGSNSSHPYAEVGTDKIYGPYIQAFTYRCQDKVLFSGPFEANTQYTVFLAFENWYWHNYPPLRINYADGTYDYLGDNDYDSDVPYVVRQVTNAGKTVSSVTYHSDSYRTKFFYDKCGIFKGDVPAEAFMTGAGLLLSALPKSSGFSLSVELPDSHQYIGAWDKLTIHRTGHVTLEAGTELDGENPVQSESVTEYDLGYAEFDISSLDASVQSVENGVFEVCSWVSHDAALALNQESVSVAHLLEDYAELDDFTELRDSAITGVTYESESQSVPYLQEDSIGKRLVLTADMEASTVRENGRVGVLGMDIKVRGIDTAAYRPETYFAKNSDMETVLGMLTSIKSRLNALDGGYSADMSEGWVENGSNMQGGWVITGGDMDGGWIA